ncbi:MAG: trypsin-like peptidase domain-containing protein [Lachnospiraceae bacterium]|nr:trypsin-like peptidase domain-containing protein [Lachnospiraceae bacterium]
MNKQNITKTILCVAAFGLITGISFFGARKIDEGFSGKQTTATKEQAADRGLMSTSIVSGGAVATGGGVSDVAEQVLPSIVQLNVTSSTTRSDIFGRSREQEATGSGSGIIISQKDGEILIATNNHVVADSKSVEVLFADEEKALAAVKGTASNLDLAVVSVKASDLKDSTRSAIKTIQIGDSKKVKVGEQAIAIGNALGYGQSVTVGYISAKDREISIEDSSMKLLQTDAAINPGNSGGALVNSAGQLIGINSAKFASEEVEGMGFAIPISDAIPIIQELMDKETIPESEQAYLGIKGREVTKEYTEYYNIPTGIYVGEVSKNSPAEKAGVPVNSIITKINGKEIDSMERMQEVLSGCRAGDKGTITVKISDNGEYKEKTLDVTFGSKSQSSES